MEKPIIESGDPTSSDDDTLELGRKSLLNQVEVNCEAVLGHGTVTLGKLEELAPGDCVPLDCSPADMVELRVNGTTIARGEIVTVKDRFGIRIAAVG